MIKEKEMFQSSINIRFDYGRTALYKRYLPTPSHAESIKGLLKGFLNEGPHSHIMIGPYGSGKSLLGTIVGGIVSRNISTDVFNQLINKFQTVDSNIYQLFSSVQILKKKFIPVILNGNEGNFKRSLLTSIYKTLIDQNLDLTQPLLVSDILSNVEMWQDRYPTTFRDFLKLLEERNWGLVQWKQDIENVDVNAIEWFREVYPTLTSGSILNINYDKHLVSQLEYVLQELHNRNMGLFIIYDEFGRLLQSLKPAEVHETMQDLQDLAEYSNKNNYENLNLLLITHRNFGQYALRYNENLTNEFQRIEKRFSTYYTKADAATFIRLSSAVTQDLRDPKHNWHELLKGIRLFNMFPDLNASELESLIVKGAFPVHPVTLFVMPLLANLVAQNERTLFTFLESDEPGGLKRYFEEHRDWYRVDQIFNYFEPAIADFEADTLIGQVYQRYQRVKKKISGSAFQSDELRVIKIFTIWEVANLYSLQIPNEDFLSFTFSWDLSYTKKVLKELSNKKIIRFNSQTDYWELFEGSGINLEQEIASRLQVQPITQRQKMELLRSILERKYILPKQYNDDKSMTRFAPIIPLYASEFCNETRISILAEKHNMDAIIAYIINDTGRDSLENQIIIDSRQEQKIIYAYCGFSDNLEKQLEFLAVLSQLLQDKYFLSQDKYLMDEIRVWFADISFKINKEFQQRLSEFSWIYAGAHIQVRSEINLGIKLSEIMSTIYTHTPEVRNEAFNRRKITKVQKAGAIKLVDRLMDFHNTGAIEIEGFGPEYLIYATVLKNNGVGLENPQVIQSRSLLELRANLITKLDLGKGGFTDLLKLFIEPPYGIRNAVIPVLLSALLIHEWKYIMFYHNGMHNANVNGELLYHMIENPAQYSYSYQPFNELHVPLINLIDITFLEQSAQTDKTLNPAVYLNRVLLKWLRSLPRITQNTQHLSDAANQLKVIIKKGEIEPDLGLEMLEHLLASEAFNLAQVKAECESYNNQHKKAIETRIYNATGFPDFSQLEMWAHSQNVIVKTANPLIKAVVSSDKDSWIDSVCEKVVGVQREHWSDTTDELFNQQVVLSVDNASRENYDSYIEVNLGGAALAIPKVKLSPKSLAIFNTTKANMTQMARTISKAELQLVLVELLKEFSKE
ncbi:hypothetical protein C7121_13265 [Paenibacillus glucanolyticus]|jgi:hypothetical protein|uniref:hypothetical protein n=1 Tax=Paenibacillus glucanolyticus TaxID=59843 RepID=UPI000D1BF67A|nr:hypothetical protein [Paenibacillus glucanolyticus]AVV57006.1 hypothetical protein C7121_13265 [Paenibacillus glucanolyticus]